MRNDNGSEVTIRSEGDLVTARRAVRDEAVALGFGVTDVTRIVTTASELTRNVFRYAGSGVMRWHTVNSGNRVGIELVFEDQGPGIADIELALTAGYTTGDGLGLGLPGARRLMDEMEIQSQIGMGTKITVKKWRK
jgi:serine/threonine-protein kinase RsbT